MSAEKDMQLAFLEAVLDERWLTVDGLAARHPALADAVTPATRHRFFIYRSSYWARVTTNLARSVYAPASEILGEEGVATFLREYFLQFPPTNERLDQAATHLVEFCRTSDLCAEHRWVADLFLYCDARWRLLGAADRDLGTWQGFIDRRGMGVDGESMEHLFDEASLRVIQLCGPACVVRSIFPLADILGLADAGGPSRFKDGGTTTLDLASAQSLFLCRRDSETLVRLVVDGAAVGLAEALARGLSMSEALDHVDREVSHLSSQRDESVSHETIKNFVTSLAHEGLLGRLG